MRNLTPIIIVLLLVHRASSNQGATDSAFYGFGLAIGGIGVIYNVLLSSLMLTIDKSKIFTFYLLNVTINIVDSLFSVVRIVFSNIRLSNTDRNGQIACNIETLLDNLLVEVSLLSLVGMSFVAKFDLCHGRKLSNKQMLMWIYGSVLYATLTSLWIVYNPWGGGATLDQSKAYCFINWGSTVDIISFALLVMLIPMSILFYNLQVIYTTIESAQKVLKSHGIQEQAKAGYIKMVLKLKYFLIAIICAYIPGAALSFYVFSTNNKPFPSVLSALSGNTVSLLYTIVNPTLFLYLNIELRDHFWDCIGIHIEKFLYDYGILLFFYPSYLSSFQTGNNKNGRLIRRKSSLINIPQQDSLPTSQQTALTQPQSWWSKYIRISKIYPTILPSTEIDHRISESTNSIDYDNVDEWLNDPILKKYFLELGRKEYCIENFLFYDDARAYHKRGLEFIEKMIDYLENSVEEEEGKVVEFTEGLIVSKSIPEDLISEWKVLENLSVRLYTLYIQAPLAPLEINIPYRLRKEISTIFKGNPKMQVSFPTLPEIIESHSMSPKRVLEDFTRCIDMYKNALETIHLVLETDLFSRFINTSQYKKGVSVHKERLKTSIVKDVLLDTLS